jgi:DNA-binding SARP family transcriptional activator
MSSSESNRSGIFRLRVLGGLSIEGAYGPLNGRVAQPRRLALLSVLGWSPDPVSRDKLIALLWPEDDARRARRHLADCVYVLRHELGHDLIRAFGDSLVLNRDLVLVDLDDFRSALSRTDLDAAVAHYAGPFLDGFHVSGADALERWAERERAALATLWGRSVRALAEAAEDRNRYGEAVGWWRLLTAAQPFSTTAAVRLMRAMAASGDGSGALAYAHLFQRRLAEELDIPKEPEVAAFVEQLRETLATASARDGSGSREDVAPSSDARTHSTRASAAAKPEVAALAKRLERAARFHERRGEIAKAARYRNALAALVGPIPGEPADG